MIKNWKKYKMVGSDMPMIGYDMLSNEFLNWDYNVSINNEKEQNNDQAIGHYSNGVDILSYDDLKFIRGLFLLNVGTVSIAVFLHTLRFKKVLPPKLAFGFYLTQIYLTFSAIPYLGHLFLRHYKLAFLVLLGMVCNMTRSRTIHAIWCVLCHGLLAHSNIEW